MRPCHSHICLISFIHSKPYTAVHRDKKNSIVCIDMCFKTPKRLFKILSFTPPWRHVRLSIPVSTIDFDCRCRSQLLSAPLLFWFVVSRVETCDVLHLWIRRVNAPDRGHLYRLFCFCFVWSLRYMCCLFVCVFPFCTLGHLISVVLLEMIRHFRIFKYFKVQQSNL